MIWTARRDYHIARGLVATGRARRLTDLGDHIWLQRIAGNFYYVPRKGGKILVGEDFGSAEPLQEKFVQAMFEAGRKVWLEAKRQVSKEYNRRYKKAAKRKAA